MREPEPEEVYYIVMQDGCPVDVSKYYENAQAARIQVHSERRPATIMPVVPLGLAGQGQVEEKFDLSDVCRCAECKSSEDFEDEDPTQPQATIEHAFVPYKAVHLAGVCAACGDYHDERRSVRNPEIC